MTRWLSVAVFAGLLSALVGAQGPTPGMSPSDQARMYHRNQLLVRAAIESSLDLSGQEADYAGYCARAEICTVLARSWAQEIESAANARESERASELTALLDRLISKGVAANLRFARDKIEAGSHLESELFRRRDDAIKVLKPLEAALRDIEPARKTVDNGVQSLEQATKVK